MNKRQKKKFKKKGYHRKCLGPDEIMIFGMRYKKIGKIKWLWKKSEITPMTPDEIKDSFNRLREWDSPEHIVFDKFLNEEDDNSEQASKEEI